MYTLCILLIPAVCEYKYCNSEEKCIKAKNEHFIEMSVCVCVCVCGCVSHSVVSDSETPWTVACQAPLWNSPEIGIYPNNECVRDTSKQWQLQKWTLCELEVPFLKSDYY